MKIHELAQKTSVHAETIRMYRNKGLMRPMQNPQNGYYEYNNEDLFTLFYIRKLRSSNISLPYISQIFSHANLKNIVKEFDKEIIRTQEKIVALQNQLELIKLNRNHLVECEKPQNQVEVMQAYGAKYDFYSFTGAADKRYHKWLECSGVCTVTLHISKEVLNGALASTPIPMQAGLGTYEQVIKRHNLPILEDMVVCDKGTCLSIIIELDNLEIMPADKLRPLQLYAQQHNYRFVSDTTAFLIRIYNAGRKRHYIFRLRARVEADA